MEKSPYINIHFLGAAGTVTGSKYLVETAEKKILIDCGLFQGVKNLRKLNWDYLPVEAGTIDVVILTHGHMDHTGFLPRLMKMGYRGPVYGTAPTLEIAEVILRDSAKIQEERAERVNQEGYSKHKPAEPLYDTKDVEKTLPLFRQQPLDKWIALGENIRYRHRYNGHILGSTFIELEMDGKLLVFSGDIGRSEDPLLHPPQKPEKADVLFIESTYGNSRHLHEDIMERLKTHILETIESNGILLIPSFAVERAQLLMYYLWQLKNARSIPDIPVYLDSPMGANVLKILHHSSKWHKLSAADCEEMCRNIKVTTSYKDTLEIMRDSKPKVVIAGSGMVNGGRILNYLAQYSYKENTTILLAGYQAEGTNGRHLQEGAEELKIYGKYYRVKAKVDALHGLSAHADQDELLDWLSEIESAPQKIFITHGEPHPADALRVKIKDTYGWEAKVPQLYEIEELNQKNRII
ncbi:MAG TPA: MBL fold metallo-hydrolase [Cryomorphaceae bacterium]|nr:MBL fold metallo-hydrolase [Owenweeksia sp.]HAD97887.1 MBL fold metallo-hydrolase [Cryomorphaceae bacterium]